MPAIRPGTRALHRFATPRWLVRCQRCTQWRWPDQSFDRQEWPRRRLLSRGVVGASVVAPTALLADVLSQSDVDRADQGSAPVSSIRCAWHQFRAARCCMRHFAPVPRQSANRIPSRRRWTFYLVLMVLSASGAIWLIDHLLRAAESPPGLIAPWSMKVPRCCAAMLFAVRLWPTLGCTLAAWLGHEKKSLEWHSGGLL